MPLPRRYDARINRRRLGRILGAHRVAMVVAVMRIGGTQMNHRSVARQFLNSINTHFCVKICFGPRFERSLARSIFGPRPVRYTIEGAAITKHHSVPDIFQRDALKFDLDPSDGTLRCASSQFAVATRKIALPQHVGGLGQHRHMLAEFTLRKFQNCSFAGTGATSEHYQLGRMC